MIRIEGTGKTVWAILNSGFQVGGSWTKAFEVGQSYAHLHYKVANCNCKIGPGIK